MNAAITDIPFPHPLPISLIYMEIFRELGMPAVFLLKCYWSQWHQSNRCLASIFRTVTFTVPFLYLTVLVKELFVPSPPVLHWTFCCACTSVPSVTQRFKSTPSFWANCALDQLPDLFSVWFHKELHKYNRKVCNRDVKNRSSTT